MIITTPQDLAHAIRILRISASLTQQELAEMSGLSRTAIQALEAGKPTSQLDTLMKALMVLNTKLLLSHPLLKDPHATTFD